MKHKYGEFAAEGPGASALTEYSAPHEKMEAVFSIHEAKTNFSKLVKRAAAGEIIYIGSYGKEETALVSVNSLPKRKKPVSEAFGCMRGKMELPEGWDDPLPDDIIESFYSMQGLEDFEVKNE